MLNNKRHQKNKKGPPDIAHIVTNKALQTSIKANRQRGVSKVDQSKAQWFFYYRVTKNILTILNDNKNNEINDQSKQKLATLVARVCRNMQISEASIRDLTPYFNDSHSSQDVHNYLCQLQTDIQHIVQYKNNDAQSKAALNLQSFETWQNQQQTAIQSELNALQQSVNIENSDQEPGYTNEEPQMMPTHQKNKYNSAQQSTSSQNQSQNVPQSNEYQRNQESSNHTSNPNQNDSEPNSNSDEQSHGTTPTVNETNQQQAQTGTSNSNSNRGTRNQNQTQIDGSSDSNQNNQNPTDHTDQNGSVLIPSYNGSNSNLVPKKPKHKRKNKGYDNNPNNTQQNNGSQYNNSDNTNSQQPPEQTSHTNQQTQTQQNNGNGNDTNQPRQKQLSNSYTSLTNNLSNSTNPQGDDNSTPSNQRNRNVETSNQDTTYNNNNRLSEQNNNIAPQHTYLNHSRGNNCNQVTLNITDQLNQSTGHNPDQPSHTYGNQVNNSTQNDNTKNYNNIEPNNPTPQNQFQQTSNGPSNNNQQPTNYNTSSSQRQSPLTFGGPPNNSIQNDNTASNNNGSSQQPGTLTFGTANGHNNQPNPGHTGGLNPTPPGDDSPNPTPPGRGTSPSGGSSHTRQLKDILQNYYQFQINGQQTADERPNHNRYTVHKPETINSNNGNSRQFDHQYQVDETHADEPSERSYAVNTQLPQQATDYQTFAKQIIELAKACEQSKGNNEPVIHVNYQPSNPNKSLSSELKQALSNEAQRQGVTIDNRHELGLDHLDASPEPSTAPVPNPTGSGR